MPGYPRRVHVELLTFLNTMNTPTCPSPAPTFVADVLSWVTVQSEPAGSEADALATAAGVVDVGGKGEGLAVSPLEEQPDSRDAAKVAVRMHSGHGLGDALMSRRVTGRPYRGNGSHERKQPSPSAASIDTAATQTRTNAVTVMARTTRTGVGADRPLPWAMADSR